MQTPAWPTPESFRQHRDFCLRAARRHRNNRYTRTVFLRGAWASRKNERLARAYFASAA